MHYLLQTQGLFFFFFFFCGSILIKRLDLPIPNQKVKTKISVKSPIKIDGYDAMNPAPSKLNGNKIGYTFQVESEGKKHRFAASSTEDLGDWTQSIRSVSHNTPGFEKRGILSYYEAGKWKQRDCWLSDDQVLLVYSRSEQTAFPLLGCLAEKFGSSATSSSSSSESNKPAISISSTAEVLLIAPPPSEVCFFLFLVGGGGGGDGGQLIVFLGEKRCNCGMEL